MAEFRKMRRADQELSKTECYDILTRNLYLTLSTKLETGWPYSVVLNYIFFEDRIYFHCALEGQKNNAFICDDRVCVSIVDKAEIIHEKASIHYRSLIVFGRVEEITESEEKKRILRNLVKKYSNNLKEAEEFREKSLASLLERTGVFYITIEHITGKQFKPTGVRP